MINHYIVCDKKTWDGGESMKGYIGEFESLETAMDFVEFYRRKYPSGEFQIRGISYSMSDVRPGMIISEWEPIPEEMVEYERNGLLLYLQS